MAAALPAFYVALAHDIIQIDAMAEFVVVDHEKAPRGQATDKKAGTGAVDMAFLTGGPVSYTHLDVYKRQA